MVSEKETGSRVLGRCFSEHPQGGRGEPQDAAGDVPAVVPPVAGVDSAIGVVDKVRDFQKQWANTVSDLARKHRDVVDKQYQAALESLDAALRRDRIDEPGRVPQAIRTALSQVAGLRA